MTGNVFQETCRPESIQFLKSHIFIVFIHPRPPFIHTKNQIATSAYAGIFSRQRHPLLGPRVQISTNERTIYRVFPWRREITQVIPRVKKVNNIGVFGCHVFPIVPPVSCFKKTVSIICEQPEGIHDMEIQKSAGHIPFPSPG